MDNIALMRQLYQDFNARNIDAVLACLAPDVLWANGMNGGHEHGPEAVRAYWSAQWSQINPRVEPMGFNQTADNTVSVDVHQVVHDLEGNLLLDERVQHVFRLENGQVVRFDIESASRLSTLSH